MTEKIMALFMRNESVNEEDREIIHYGMECMLAKLINILLPLPAVLYMKAEKEYLLFLILFGILRTKVGGYHADTRLRCFILSYLMIMAAIIWTSIGSTYSLLWILLTEAIIYIIAPVDTENKRLNKDDKRYYRKIYAGWLIPIDAVLVISLYMGYTIYARVLQIVLLCLLMLLAAGIVKNGFIHTINN